MKISIWTNLRDKKSVFIFSTFLFNFHLKKLSDSQ